MTAAGRPRTAAGGTAVVVEAPGEHRLVPHEPCAFDCALSAKYAAALFAAYTARAPTAAERLHHTLMRPVLVAPGLELRPTRF